MEFWFDVACPFAYLAATQVQSLAEEARAPIVWRPILLGGLLREHRGAADPNEAMPAAKRAWVRRDAALQAARLGQPLVFPDAHPQRTLAAMRLLTAAPAAVVPPLALALYRAYWVEGRDVAERAVLAEIGARFGIDVAVLDDPAVKDQLRAATSAAAARGVFGVPTFTVDSERLWGVDRLPFVREALGLPPRAPEIPRLPGGKLVFYHDLASPFSYLASTGVEALAARAGATLEQRPILVGALFTAIGTPLVPLATFSAAKESYYREDLARWAARRGVPFRYASEFPIRTVVANRVAIAEPRATSALYRAAWGEDRPISTAEQVRAVLDAAGFDGAALLARAEDPAIKDQLRRNTEEAVQIGVCGVPSFVVRAAGAGADTAPFWGQDRMDLVEAALGGA